MGKSKSGPNTANLLTALVTLLVLGACGGGGGGVAGPPPAASPPPPLGPQPEPRSTFSTGPHDCLNGSAGEFPCLGISLRKRVDYADIGGTFSNVVDPGSDVWGWVDPQSGKEYALVALSDGTAFVDVSDPENPQFLGKLPTSNTDSGDRDVKVSQDHAYIVAGPANHGMQVFDLTRLRIVTSPQEFNADAEYRDFGEAKNVAINEETGFAYAMRTFTCGGVLHIVDIGTPNNPVFAGCHGGGNSLDAQCITYRGPDADYLAREICFSSNVDHLGIIDVTDKTSTVDVARATAANIELYHQGWLTDDRRYFLLNDELDESRLGVSTRTHVFDVSDLDSPLYVGAYEAATSAADHNLFIFGDLVFEANRAAGLRVLEIGDLANLELKEVAFFDTEPDNDTTDTSKGAGSVYPYFPSGTIVVVDRSGLFILAME